MSAQPLFLYDRASKGFKEYKSKQQTQLREAYARGEKVIVITGKKGQHYTIDLNNNLQYREGSRVQRRVRVELPSGGSNSLHNSPGQDHLDVQIAEANDQLGKERKLATHTTTNSIDFQVLGVKDQYLVSQQRNPGGEVLSNMSVAVQEPMNISGHYARQVCHASMERYLQTVIRALMKDHSLLDRVTPPMLTARTPNHVTLLHYAVGHNQAVVCDGLLLRAPASSKDAIVNARRNNGETPLLLACALGLYEVCEVLLRHGANPLLRTARGFSCSMATAIINRYDILLLLLVNMKGTYIQMQYPTASSALDRVRLQLHAQIDVLAGKPPKRTHAGGPEDLSGSGAAGFTSDALSGSGGYSGTRQPRQPGDAYSGYGSGFGGFENPTQLVPEVTPQSMFRAVMSEFVAQEEGDVSVYPGMICLVMAQNSAQRQHVCVYSGSCACRNVVLMMMGNIPVCSACRIPAVIVKLGNVHISCFSAPPHPSVLGLPYAETPMLVEFVQRFRDERARSDQQIGMMREQLQHSEAELSRVKRERDTTPSDDYPMERSVRPNTAFYSNSDSEAMLVEPMEHLSVEPLPADAASWLVTPSDEPQYADPHLFYMSTDSMVAALPMFPTSDYQESDMIDQIMSADTLASIGPLTGPTEAQASPFVSAPPALGEQPVAGIRALVSTLVTGYLDGSIAVPHTRLVRSRGAWPQLGQDKLKIIQQREFVVVYDNPASPETMDDIAYADGCRWSLRRSEYRGNVLSAELRCNNIKSLSKTVFVLSDQPYNVKLQADRRIVHSSRFVVSYRFFPDGRISQGLAHENIATWDL
eukprot:TRINITY_DN5696_c0_g1_i1.p1 TRINITY_DN5696_c0_g1~~TRINITY_DN5696_c0_g1_i1.p1  ORF type:complete len:814 (+),score=140.57 TRINITY_DN5696_c0_g1_i1:94-2535(+)